MIGFSVYGDMRKAPPDSSYWGIGYGNKTLDRTGAEINSKYGSPATDKKTGENRPNNLNFKWWIKV